MRILIVNLYYYPQLIGGTEHSVKLLAENLVNHGNKVLVYTQDGTRDSHGKCEEINGVKVYRGYLNSTSKRIRQECLSIAEKLENRCACLYNRVSTEELKYLVEKFQPDVIHTNNLLSISYKIWSIASSRNIKVVNTLRDYWLIDPKFIIGASEPVTEKLHQHIFRRISNKNSIIVTAPSDCTLNLFKKYGYFENSRFIRVFNSVNYDTGSVKKIIAEKTKRSDDNIIFLYVGKLGEYKGVGRLLDAFKYIRNPNIKLYICGSGPMESQVHESLEKDPRIIYFGQLESGKLSEIYDQADVLVVPSIWEEPFGRIVIEGAIHGLAVIGSNRGGIPEIVGVLKNGIVINPDNKIEFENALHSFMNRETIRYYANNILCNIDEFSGEKQIENFMKIYTCD